MSSDPSPSEVGFLSPELSRVCSGHRLKYAAWFDLSDQINRSCQSIVSNLTVGPDEILGTHLFSVLFLLRSLSNFQGAIIMAERGMVVEARTLIRCCYENLFCVSVLRNEGDKFLDEMQKGEIASVKSKARWILSEPSRLEFSGEGAAERLKQHVEKLDKEWGKLSLLEWKSLAERGGVGDAYLYYKVLSGDSAHPSISAIDRYVRRNANGTFSGYTWGVDSDGIPEALNFGCNAMIMIGLAVSEMLGDATRQDQFGNQAMAYAKLNGL
jgi:hypothetical protein